MAEIESESTDKRVQRSKAKVLEVAYDLLTREGLGGVSVDEVTRRSGVAKTTIYRHWPSRSALILDACSNLNKPLEAPDTGSWAGDAAMLAAYLALELREGAWPSALPSIIDAAERDSDVAQMQLAAHVRFTGPFIEAAERGSARGELPAGLTASGAAAALIGPLYFRRWFSREEIDQPFIDAVVASVAPRAGTGAKPRGRKPQRGSDRT